MPRRRQAAADPAQRQLWRIVDGAVFDALYTHQDYLTPKGQRSARLSIVKRVVGSIIGYAEQSAQGRSGQPAPDRVAAQQKPSPARRGNLRRVETAGGTPAAGRAENQ